MENKEHIKTEVDVGCEHEQQIEVGGRKPVSSPLQIHIKVRKYRYSWMEFPGCDKPPRMLNGICRSAETNFYNLSSHLAELSRTAAGVLYHMRNNNPLVSD